MSNKFIPGIYNYCDRWCERCTMSGSCALYSEEQAAIAANPDIADKDNPAFWNYIGEQFKKTMKMIMEDAAKRGIDLTMTEEDMQAYDEARDLERKKQDATLYIKLARQYRKTAKAWLDEHVEALRDLSIQQLELNMPDAEAKVAKLSDALDVIYWYLFQIEIKLRRATDSFEINNEDDDDLQSDANGSAKVALLAIERSLGAWSVLHEELPEEQDVILDFLVVLQKIRGLVKGAFPNAMAFKRAGFDD
jgi:hypothetical protein